MYMGRGVMPTWRLSVEEGVKAASKIQFDSITVILPSHYNRTQEYLSPRVIETPPSYTSSPKLPYLLNCHEEGVCETFDYILVATS